jgi:hypothetical protein
VERHVLENILSPNLRAYVVWLPVRRAGNVEAAARQETRLVADQRASHFSAGDARLGNRYGPIIHLPEGVPAWDVYFIFGPAVHWDATPPPPTYWMHQLGRSAPAELRLDSKQLARAVNGLLDKTEKSPVGSAMN